MKKIFLLIFCLFFIQNVWSQGTRKPLSADEIKLKNELKNDNEFVQVNCGHGRQQDTIYPGAKFRLKAYTSFNDDAQKSKLKIRCSTIEGTPVYSYLIVEKNKATVVIDGSEDRFGPMRVFSYQCSELDIGIYFFGEKERKMIFQKIESSKVKDQQIVLRCLAGEKELIF